jgi:membrane protein required for beta-lactamase induction
MTLLEALEYLPARLSVLTFGIAGTLVPVLEELRATGLTRWRVSASLVARCALAAIDHGRIRDVISGDSRTYRINQVYALVRRALVAWVIVIAGVAIAFD